MTRLKNYCYQRFGQRDPRLEVKVEIVISSCLRRARLIPPNLIELWSRISNWTMIIQVTARKMKLTFTSIEHLLGAEGRNPGVGNPVSTSMISRHGRETLRLLDAPRSLLLQVPPPTPIRKLDIDYLPLSCLHLLPRSIHPRHIRLHPGWTDSHYQQTTGDSMGDGVWQKIGRSHLNWSHNRSYRCFTLAIPFPILQAQEHG